jgi:hypothetical protein
VGLLTLSSLTWFSFSFRLELWLPGFAYANARRRLYLEDAQRYLRATAGSLQLVDDYDSSTMEGDPVGLRAEINSCAHAGNRPTVAVDATDLETLLIVGQCRAHLIKSIWSCSNRTYWGLPPRSYVLDHFKWERNTGGNLARSICWRVTSCRNCAFPPNAAE